MSNESVPDNPGIPPEELVSPLAEDIKPEHNADIVASFKGSLDKALKLKAAYTESSKNKPRFVALDIKINFLKDEIRSAGTNEDYKDDSEGFKQRKTTMEAAVAETEGAIALAQVEEVRDLAKIKYDLETDPKTKEALGVLVAILSNIKDFNGFSSMGEMRELVDIPDVDYETAAKYAGKNIRDELGRIKALPEEDLSAVDEEFLVKHDKYRGAVDRMNVELSMPFFERDISAVRDMIGTRDSVNKSLEKQGANYTERQMSLTAELTKIRGILNLIEKRRNFILKSYDDDSSTVSREGLEGVMKKYDELEDQVNSYKVVIGELLTEGIGN